MIGRIRDDIFYQEELDMLLMLVEQRIRATSPVDYAPMIALGHTHLKLTKLRETAPSVMTADKEN